MFHRLKNNFDNTDKEEIKENKQCVKRALESINVSGGQTFEICESAISELNKRINETELRINKSNAALKELNVQKQLLSTGDPGNIKKVAQRLQELFK